MSERRRNHTSDEQRESVYCSCQDLAGIRSKVKGHAHISCWRCFLRLTHTHTSKQCHNLSFKRMKMFLITHKLYLLDLTWPPSRRSINHLIWSNEPLNNQDQRWSEHRPQWLTGASPWKHSPNVHSWLYFIRASQTRVHKLIKKLIINYNQCTIQRNGANIAQFHSWLVSEDVHVHIFSMFLLTVWNWK